MERIRKGSDLPKKSGGHRASDKNIRTPSQRKGHQLYISTRGARFKYMTWDARA